MRKIIGILVVICFLTPLAHASYISLNTTVTSKVTENTLKVLVSVINKGDEAAHNVQAKIRVGDQKILTEKRDQLEVDQTYTGYATFNLPYKTPGQYPLVLVMHYADANQYPFSALTCQTFSYKAGAAPSDIFGQMKGDTFWKQGEAKLLLKNMGEVEIETQVKIIAPRELTVIGEDQKVILLPKAEKKISFPIKNFSALSGSTYQLFALSEYENQGFHRAIFVPGTVRVNETKTVLGINYLYLVFILIVLVFLFLAFQLFKK